MASQSPPTQTGNPIVDAALAGYTLVAGVGGAVVAEVTQTPSVTWGSILAAAIGLAALWVNRRFTLLEKREQFASEERRAHDDLTRVVVELRSRLADAEDDRDRYRMEARYYREQCGIPAPPQQGVENEPEQGV